MGLGLVALISSIGIAVISGFWALIRWFAESKDEASKDSKKVLFTRLDELREETEQLKYEQVRLAAKLETCPKHSDISESLEKMEKHIDKRIDALERHISSLVELVTAQQKGRAK